MKKLNQRILLVSILISLFFVGNVMGQDAKPYEFKMLKWIANTACYRSLHGCCFSAAYYGRFYWLHFSLHFGSRNYFAIDELVDRLF